jgi:hypothetical protein
MFELDAGTIWSEGSSGMDRAENEKGFVNQMQAKAF